MKKKVFALLLEQANMYLEHSDTNKSRGEWQINWGNLQALHSVTRRIFGEGSEESNALSKIRDELELREEQWVKTRNEG